MLYLLPAVAHKEPDKSVINKECACLYTVPAADFWSHIFMQIWEYLHKIKYKTRKWNQKCWMKKNKMQIKFPKCMKKKLYTYIKWMNSVQ